MGDTLNPAANWDYFTYPLPPSGTTLYIAAQAEVSKPGDSETAWGALPCGSYGFPGKNWATYFTYTVPTLAFNTGITSNGVSCRAHLLQDLQSQLVVRQECTSSDWQAPYQHQIL